MKVRNSVTTASRKSVRCKALWKRDEKAIFKPHGAFVRVDKV